ALRLYRRALELGATSCPPWRLHAKLGMTLANIGRGGEAAEQFVSAARELAASDAEDPQVSHLRRQAAEHYMRSGAYDAGLAVLRDVLVHAGLRYFANPRRVILSLIVNRARLRLRHVLPVRRATRPLPPRDAEVLEVCWSAGLGLGVSDTLRAADF